VIQKYVIEFSPPYFLFRLEAGVFEDSFDDKINYDDNMIIELIDAASEVLGISFCVFFRSISCSCLIFKLFSLPFFKLLVFF